ncbi:MAG: C25 family cysteine peptidase, partial [Candidatus Promineifilaceae bacterium]
VLQLTCLTGLFAHPTIASLAEVMLLGEDGPLSIVAATSLTLSEHQQPFGVAFLKALQDPEVARVGDAFQQAKAQLDLESDNALREISDTFTLFGDPTALIRRPGPQ